MNNYIQPGEVIDHTPSATLAAGDVVVIGKRIGIAETDIAANDAGSVAVEGVFSVAKASGAIQQGALVYWDTTNDNATTTATGNTLAGYAFAAAASADAAVAVKLNA